MNNSQSNRRRFIKHSLTAAAGLAATTLPSALEASSKIRVISSTKANPVKIGAARIKFAVIGLNHNHIYGQVEAVTKGGGEPEGAHFRGSNPPSYQ